ncbi:hypothetical protein HDU67_009280 [Dinochytrium kinnereticum]|nr:hypothetical protein HDU67_009280 [Dinochytrium kinnereticum]
MLMRLSRSCRSLPLHHQVWKLSSIRHRTLLEAVASARFHSSKSSAERTDSITKRSLIDAPNQKTMSDERPGEASARLLREMTDISRTAVPLSPIRKVVIVSRPGREICSKTMEVTRWLVAQGIHVLLGKPEYDALVSGEWHVETTSNAGTVGYWTKAFCREKANEVDLIITLGGDGTVLYTNYNKVPPILPFHLGSLGFLTVFEFASYPDILSRILEGEPQRMNYRMRLKASVHKYEGSRKDGDRLFSEHGRDHTIANLAEYDMPKGKPKAVGHILNEVVVERGANPTMMTLELFAGKVHLTTLLADGLVIATPTGSTAYNLSAGGSLVHPDKASILVTPICPHTLTTRPMVLPAHLDLRLCVALDTRTTAWISLDGRDRFELGPGDNVLIRAAKYPLMTVCREDSSSDWFNALVTSLGWNVRKRQKSNL